uniref:Receptor-like protein 12 n=1 Tax=Triticum urartu TaxID=4572 RepID=A0A8R7PPJ5_TRIUA
MLSIVDEEDENLLISLPNISVLKLASCNLTKIPQALRYLDRVINLDLSNNQINGVIPSWIWESWKDEIKLLNLSHNMFTSLERSPSLLHMPYLSMLDLSFNRLQGSIPIPVTLHSSIFATYNEVLLDYSNNNFSSILDNFGKYVQNVTYLKLSKNKLTGHVPSSICSSIKLTILELSYTNFSGSIPSCLIGSGNLKILKLRENQFQGMLPEDIREGCKFQTIDLNGNKIEGKIPRSLSNCQDLELLDVGNNHIVGSFPSWLGALPKLRVLVLRSNQLNGTTWDIKGDHTINKYFSSLQILDLASNNFSGNLTKGWFDELNAMMENVNDEGQVIGHQTNLPDGFYQDTVTVTFKDLKLNFTKILTAFKVIDFSHNSFDGPIPESIGRLVSLHGLNMSYNNFTGQIPSQFSNLSRLESFDLSRNQIAGEIPPELTSLTSLGCLDFSYNNLSGRIPQGNQFSTFSVNSFEGNADLCGLPLSKECENQNSVSPSEVAPPEYDNLWRDKLGVILLFAFVGLGFGVGFALAFLLRLYRRMEGLVSKQS